jgi:hypothetical protein
MSQHLFFLYAIFESMVDFAFPQMIPLIENPLLEKLFLLILESSGQGGEIEKAHCPISQLTSSHEDV